MIVMIDNYDSFTYNLVQYIREQGQEVHVVRNDRATIAEIEALHPTHIVVSPGPCTPNEAGISLQAIAHFAGKVPVLGVCLGHQSIGQVFGGRVVKAEEMMHGKTSMIEHVEDSIFSEVKNPFRATRYHSLVVEKDTLPDVLQVIAWSSDGEIMGLRHKEHAVVGLQFHPESIMTDGGKEMIRNFLAMRERVTA